MDYAEALKKVQGAKAKDNYMAFELAYDKKLVLPYKDGIIFLSALNTAEQLHEPYGSGQHRIAEFDRKSINVTILSHDEYIRIKIAALLGISPEEAKPDAITT